jgi:hypothetical protein
MSPRMLLAVVPLLALLTAAFSGRVLFADDRAAKPELVKMLEVGWGESFRSLEPAGEHYERAKEAAPSSPTVRYAFAVVHLKHRKYAEAAKLLDEAISLDKRHLPAREARLWIDMLLKKYPSALVQMEQLAALLPREEDPALDEEARERHGETARYLGRLLAFLHGPAQKSVDLDRVDAVQQAVEERLYAALRKEFEAGYQAVSERFEEMYLTSEQSKEQAKAEAEKSQQREAKRLAEDREAVSKAKQAALDRAMTSREELEKFLTNIDKKLSPLDREYGRLSAEAAGVRQRMFEVDREISRTLTLMELTEDPGLRFRYRIEVDRLEGIYARQITDYRGLEAQAARVRSQQAALIRERDGAISRYNAEAKRLGKEQVQLGTKAKRIARDEEKNRRPPTGNTDKVRVFTDKVFAFTTYEPFPLEQAKARLLESVR